MPRARIVMWSKLAAIAVGAGVLLALLFWPISVDIRVDLPPTTPPDRGTTTTTFSYDPVLTAVAVVTLVLGVAGWMMWRVIRRYRDQKPPSA